MKKDPSKVIVAKSDFDHVIEAIDGVMEVARSSSSSTNTNNSNNKHDEDRNTNKSDRLHHQEKEEEKENQNMEIDKEVKEQQESVVVEGDEEDRTKDVFLSHVQNSLKGRLYQIVQPISDEEFHQRTRGPIIQQQIQQEDEAERLDIVQEEIAIQQQEQAEKRLVQLRQRGVNLDYDDHELIDQEALKRAKELRVQVRTMAMKTRQQQDAILERAIELATREIRLLTQDILLSEQQEGHGELMNRTDLDNYGQQQQSATTSTASDAGRHILQQVESSLRTLSNSLSNTVDKALPKNLQDLRDTINNIQKSLQKKEEPLTLSQTEQAIFSRDNEGLHHLDCVGEEEEGEGEGDDDNENRPALIELELDTFCDKANAEYLLADFLRQY